MTVTPTNTRPTAATAATVQDRYKAALATARKRGVRIRQNVDDACCRSCSDPFAKTPGFDRQSTPYGWTFGGQGGSIQWIDGLPYYRDLARTAASPWSVNRKRVLKQARTERIYFSHGNGGGQVLADAFVEQGFRIADFDPAEPDLMAVTVLIEFPEED